MITADPSMYEFMQIQEYDIVTTITQSRDTVVCFIDLVNRETK